MLKSALWLVGGNTNKGANPSLPSRVLPHPSRGEGTDKQPMSNIESVKFNGVLAPEKLLVVFN
jgi:hypothetical protein